MRVMHARGEGRNRVLRSAPSQERVAAAAREKPAEEEETPPLNRHQRRQLRKMGWADVG